jgi:hypothetical protein
MLIIVFLFSALCNGKVNVHDSDITPPKVRSLPVMTNGINTKTDVELLIEKEAKVRGLRLSDMEASTGARGTNSALKDPDALTHLRSKKLNEDHNLNELDKSPSEGNTKTSKGGHGRSASFGAFGKGSSKMNGRAGGGGGHSKECEDVDDEDSDSDSLSNSSNSVGNSRKSSRSNSPKVGDSGV